MYIDIFSGCGGLSLGLFNSGLWKGKFAIEKSEDAFQTLKHNLIDQNNHFDWPDWFPKKNNDINDIIKKYSDKLKSMRGQIDLVAGGPPCQGFSTAGKRDESDLRNKLVVSYIKFIRLVQPRIIFFENVKGFTQQFDKNKIKGRIYSEFVQKELRKSSKTNNYIGYNVYGKLVDFSEFGIPQKRTRFILVGIRKDCKESDKPSSFFEIIKNNRYDFLQEKGIGFSPTLEDAISDLLRKSDVISPDSSNFKAGVYDNPKSKYQELLRRNVVNILPDSHRFANHKKETTEKFSYILKYSKRNKTLSKDIKEKFKLKKRTIIPLDGNSPTPTITTLPDDYIHYREPRICTVREYARIQSFNDWYEFKGKYTTGGKQRVIEVPRYSQIGNAIPPLFSEQAANVLYDFV